MTDSNKTKFQQNVRFNAITPEGMLVECETLFTFKTPKLDARISSTPTTKPMRMEILRYMPLSTILLPSNSMRTVD